MQIHQIKRTTKLAKNQRIGRGGKRGTTSGRGTKGQLARSGHKLYPEIRDAIKRLPKLRGYRFKSFQTKVTPVNLRAIETAFSAGAIVTPAELVAKKLVRTASGKVPAIKILATGNLSKKLSFTGLTVSASAKEKIEKVGGSVS